jgi:acyl transferase domain-containing protein
LKPDSESLLAKSEYAQPLSTAVQIGLINMLKLWGITPAAVIGHSSGEIAAAYAAGALTSDEAIIVAYFRGLGSMNMNHPGGMAAVGMGRDEATRFLQKGVVIACDNSPSSVTLSGDECVLESVTKNIKSCIPDVFVRKLRVEMG